MCYTCATVVVGCWGCLPFRLTVRTVAPKRSGSQFKHVVGMAEAEEASRRRVEVYKIRDKIDKLITTEPETALAVYGLLLRDETRLAERVATHWCLLKLGAKIGMWMHVKQSGRKQYAEQLLRQLENPNDISILQDMTSALTSKRPRNV